MRVSLVVALPDDAAPLSTSARPGAWYSVQRFFLTLYTGLFRLICLFWRPMADDAERGARGQKKWPKFVRGDREICNAGNHCESANNVPVSCLASSEK